MQYDFLQSNLEPKSFNVCRIFSFVVKSLLSFVMFIANILRLFYFFQAYLLVLWYVADFNLTSSEVVLWKMMKSVGGATKKGSRYSSKSDSFEVKGIPSIVPLLDVVWRMDVKPVG